MIKFLEKRSKLLNSESVAYVGDARFCLSLNKNKGGRKNA
jgi:hypothetical protein